MPMLLAAPREAMDTGLERGATYSFSRYLLLSSVGVYFHYLFAFLPHVHIHGGHAAVFAAVLFLTGPLILLLPIGIPLLILRRFARRPVWLYVPAVLAFAAVHLFLVADRFLLSMYNFHVNGFVWNLVTTPGGIDSLGASVSTDVTVGVLATALIALQAALIPVSRRTHYHISRRARWSAIFLLGALFVAEKADYGWSRFRFKGPILAVADAFPFYIRCDLSGLAASLGFERNRRDPELPSAQEGLRLHYPLVELRRRPEAPLRHIVWLVSESWRADMLDPEVMPATWAFSQRCLRFRNHYSGGNGTRTGMFSMFYGLPGPYWFPFVEEQRGPVLMDLLLREGYDVQVYTSAAFTYPEFDRTVWSRVPTDRMVEATGNLRWLRDREIVDKLTERLRTLSANRPSFTFQFFESPHAPYTFPPECAFRKPFVEDFNYVTADFRRDISLIRNRYLNACRHLDTQVDRVIRTLEETGLMDSTILVLTGDHGEEFLEKGRWGHNSAFTEEQTRVPLLLWIPGQGFGEIDRLSSHLDLPATLFAQLGVENPPEDYSLGFDLLGPMVRDHVLVSDWNDLARVDVEGKISISMKNYGVLPKVTTREDAPVVNPRGFLERRRPALLEMMRGVGRFRH